MAVLTILILILILTLITDIISDWSVGVCSKCTIVCFRFLLNAQLIILTQEISTKACNITPMITHSMRWISQSKYQHTQHRRCSSPIKDIKTWTCQLPSCILISFLREGSWVNAVWYIKKIYSFCKWSKSVPSFEQTKQPLFSFNKKKCSFFFASFKSVYHTHVLFSFFFL